MTGTLIIRREFDEIQACVWFLILDWARCLTTQLAGEMDLGRGLTGARKVLREELTYVRIQ